MKWSDSIGIPEWICLGFVVLFYVLYISKTVRVGRLLNSQSDKLHYKLILRTIYLALIIVAIMGPSFGQSTKEIKSLGKDIFIAVDLSESMNTMDVAPTRLNKLKFELKNIVDAFSSDRIGLIMFSNEAYMQCPLTYDKSALGLFIETLHTSLVPNTGTDFGPALKMALDKIGAEDDETSDRQKYKIVILISDGEDFGDDTESIAQQVKEEGVKLFTLGIGTSNGGKIPTRRGYKKDRQGQDVVSKLNPVSLKKLASDTEGLYFEINDKQNDVKKLINSINKIEGELRDSKKVEVEDNKYYYFLSVALVLMLLDALIKVKNFRL